MTTLLLIRHALTDAIGNTLSGWMEGVRLSAAGRQQAEQLARALADRQLHAIYSSPIERALETARTLATPHALVPRPCTDAGEVQLGGWTGRSFEELARDASWQRWNRQRSRARAPNGEMLLETQVRIVACLERLAATHPEQTIALVSHGDVIRAALTYYLGIPIDLLLRLEVSPASISTLQLSADTLRVQCINEVIRGQPEVGSTSASS